METNLPLNYDDWYKFAASATALIFGYSLWVLHSDLNNPSTTERALYFAIAQLSIAIVFLVVAVWKWWVIQQKLDKKRDLELAKLEAEVLQAKHHAREAAAKAEQEEFKKPTLLEKVLKQTGLG